MHIVVIIVGVISAVAAAIYFTGRSAPAEKIIQALQDGARVIDVRTAREYKGGHYPGSVNIPVNQIASRSKTLGDPSKTIVLYCHSGMRSASARRIIMSKGFKNVINAGTYHRIMQLTSGNKK